MGLVNDSDRRLVQTGMTVDEAANSGRPSPHTEKRKDSYSRPSWRSRDAYADDLKCWPSNFPHKRNHMPADPGQVHAPERLVYRTAPLARPR